MSILLDALRKSESQRRRGELPNIHSSVPIEGPQRRPRSAWPWVVALVALLIAAGAAWRAGWLGPPPEEDALPAPTPLTTVETPGPTVDTEAAVVEATPPGAADGARTPLERLRDRAPSDREPQVVDGPVPPPATLLDPALDSIAVEGDATPGEGVDVRPLADAPPPSAPTTRELEADVSEAVPEPPTPRPQPAEQPAEQAAEQTAQQPAGPAPLEFWELPLDVRQGLPDFRITVLVYDQDPARRFVLLNGERQVEGDFVGPDLVLEQIRRDGAVFRHGRYRFLVKR